MIPSQSDKNYVEGAQWKQCGQSKLLGPDQCIPRDLMDNPEKPEPWANLVTPQVGF